MQGRKPYAVSSETGSVPSQTYQTNRKRIFHIFTGRPDDGNSPETHSSPDSKTLELQLPEHQQKGSFLSELRHQQPLTPPPSDRICSSRSSDSHPLENQINTQLPLDLIISVVSDPSIPRSHRRLYVHPTNSKALSVDLQPLMLVPKARVREDNLDHFRLGDVIPQNGLESVRLSTITGSSGWIGMDPNEHRMHGVRPRITTYPRLRKQDPDRDSSFEGFLPFTTNSASNHQREIILEEEEEEEEVEESGSYNVDRSNSADSGIDSNGLPPLLSDVVSIFHRKYLASHRSSGTSVSDATIASELQLCSNSQDANDRTSSSISSVVSYNSHDFGATLPEHLDSFGNAAEVWMPESKRVRRSTGSLVGGAGCQSAVRRQKQHGKNDNCSMCREFERLIRERTDRCHGGPESLFDWLFSKSVKRRELEGAIKKKYVLQSRRTHFCNFVHQVNLHQRNLDSTSEALRQDFEGDYADRTKSLMNGTANRDQLPAPPKGLRTRTPNGLRARPGSPTSETGDYDESSNDLHTANKVKKSKQGEGSATKGGIPVFNIPSFQSKSGEQSSHCQRPQDESLQSGSGQVSRRKSALKIKDKQTSSSKSGTPDDQESKSGRTRLPISKKTKTKRSDKRNAKEPPMLGDSLPLGGGEHLDGTSDDKLVAEPIDLNLKVPDLPSIPTPNKENAGRQSKHKAERHLIDSIDQENISLPNELLTLDSLLTNGYEFRDMESSSDEALKKKRVSWFTDRMALSQQASRFELPMDMKSLEKMTTQEYLKKYCVVTSRRLNLYQKHFSKHKDRNSQCLNCLGLETCLKEVLVEALKENTLKDLYALLDITRESSIDFSLFSGIAALAERILYPYFTTEDTVNKPEYQRERIETVDFEALDWKLHGIKVSDNMRKLLKMIE